MRKSSSRERHQSSSKSKYSMQTQLDQTDAQQYVQQQARRDFNIQSMARTNVAAQFQEKDLRRYLSKNEMKQLNQFYSQLKQSRSPSPQLILKESKVMREKSREKSLIREKSESKEKSQSLTKIPSKPYFVQQTETKTITDINLKRRGRFNQIKSKTSQYIYKENEENIEDLEEFEEEEENESNQISQRVIPEFNVGQITMKRTRKRSYNEDENDIQGSSNNDGNYFSHSRSEIPSNRYYLKPREMQDIQNESMNTSYHITHQSFKWSTELNKMLQTRKKGTMIEGFSDNKILFKSSNVINQTPVGKSLQDSSKKDRGLPYVKQTSLEMNVESYNLAHSFSKLKNAQEFGELTDLYQKQSYSFSLNSAQSPHFKYLHKLDQGSFGQVDLYYLDLQDEVTQSQNTFKEQSKEPEPQQESKNEKMIKQSFKNLESQEMNYKKSSLYFIDTPENNQSNTINGNSNNNNNNNKPNGGGDDAEFDTGKIMSSPNGSYSLRIINNHPSTFQNPNKVIVNKNLNNLYQQTNTSKQDNTLSLSNINNYFNNDTNGDGTIRNRNQSNNLLSDFQIDMMNSKNMLPVVGKQIMNFDEYIRELFIMQTVECDYMPRLLGNDIEQRILYLEMGLCSLYDLKMNCQFRNYQLNDQFTYSILINLIQAIEALLSNYNNKESKSHPLFHSDIKPQNVILTIKKNQESQKSEIKLLLIDYGGSSFELEDYWSYFTPAFVCPHLWEKLVNSRFKQEFLTWPEVRYAEIYAACRSVQFLILEDKKKDLFNKENHEQFIREYELNYPKTCKILEKVYSYISDYKIFSDYKNLFASQEFFNQNHKIEFDEEKLFQFSKFYNFTKSS